MKVLIVDTVPFRINGISNIILNYYRYTKDQVDYDFVINDFIHPSYESELRADGCRLFRLENRNKSPFSYIRKLEKIIRDGNYDVVHIHGNSALMSIELLACERSKSKAKRIVHAHNTDCTHRTLHRLLYGWFIQHYDCAIACSKAAGEWLYGEHPHRVLNNGIRVERFVWNPILRKEMRKRLQLSERDLVLLHVGLFNEQKNHVFLIDVFREVVQRNPNAKLRLVGKGDTQVQIRRKVAQYGLESKVTFVGETLYPQEEYHAADVFVMPSLYESFGLVTVEAQCSGLPCVLSDRIPKEIAVTENVAFLPLEQPVEAWAEQILAFAECERSDHQADVVKKGYSIEREARALVEMYREILP